MNKTSTLRNTTIVLIILFLTQSVFAKENYLPGYIVKNPADTIHGFINFRDWNKNPLTIEFKRAMTDPASTFSCREIKSFFVNDVSYVSATFQNDISMTRSTMIVSDGNLQLDTLSGFIEILISGSKVLGSYKNSSGIKSFYIKKDTLYELLIYKEYLSVQKDAQQVEQTVLTKNKSYLNQLSNYLNDCPGIQYSLKNTVYTQTDLVKIFEYYYKCTQTYPVYIKKQESLKVVFGISAGITLSTLKMTSDANIFSYLTQSEFSRSDNLIGGITMDLIFPKNNKKWSLNSELLFSTIKFRNEYLQISNSSNSILHHTEIGGNYLKLNNMVRYRISSGRNTINLNAGISNGIALQVFNNDFQSIQYYNTITNETHIAIEDYRKHEQSILVGIGYQFSKLSLEYRFEKSNGMSKFSLLGSSVTRNYIIFNYYF